MRSPAAVTTTRGDTSRCRARARKVAICSRVTGSLGQNNVLSGGLQPLVIPAAANAPIFAACTEPAISANEADPAGKPNALTKNVAICSRVTTSVGQNNVLPGGLQPLVIPASAIASIAGSYIEPLSSVNVPPGSRDAPATGAAANSVAHIVASTNINRRLERIALPFHSTADRREVSEGSVGTHSLCWQSP